MSSRTLYRHRDIQNWVSDHHGMPAIRRVPNRFGQIEARLELIFERARRAAGHAPSVDDGMSPVSWSAWLAELDRRQLALRIEDRAKPDFQLVARRELN